MLTVELEKITKNKRIKHKKTEEQSDYLREKIVKYDACRLYE